METRTLRIELRVYALITRLQNYYYVCKCVAVKTIGHFLLNQSTQISSALG